MTFDQALARYLKNLTDQSAFHYSDNPKPSFYEVYSVGLSRYVRVVRLLNGKQAHSFVDLTTGNVFRPASWKGPDTSLVMGNIYTYTDVSEVASTFRS